MSSLRTLASALAAAALLGAAAAGPAPSAFAAADDLAGAPGGAPAITTADAGASVVDRGPLGQSGTWYTDGDGRAFLTAGVNMVYKHDPYTPEAAGFDEADAQWLADNGFDSVRLGIIWKAVEPEPGVYDDAYLDSIRRTADMLADHGLAVLVDAHQDMYNERFEGEFAPDWAVIDDGVPSVLKVGFPTNQAVNIGLLRAYDNFLMNREGPGGVGLQDRYAAMWSHVAERFADMPGLMGFDIINEPWPGSAYPLCYLAAGDCGPAADRLNELHDKVGQAIVARAPEAIVHYEPYSMWNMGLNTRPARPNVPNAALSWHVYCPTNAIAGTYHGCGLPDGATFGNASSLSATQDSATLLSEFGATDDAGTLNGVLGLARKHLTGWQYWSYCGCDDPTTQNQREQGIVADPTVEGPVTPDAVNQAKLAILAAPHARAIAGTPTSTTWDEAGKVYEASWTADRVDGNGAFPAGSVSELAVPSVNYPGGYRVEVTGGRVISAPNAMTLHVASDGTGPVTVRVLPA